MGVGSLLTTGLLTYFLSPKKPSYDATNYDLLRQTQEQANADSDAAKARIEEAAKREKLRQQALAGQNILTADTGDESLPGSKDIVLGKGKVASL
jgi:hypothetical protein